MKLNVNNLEVVLYSNNKEEYISLTDMAKFKDIDRTNYIIQNWIRSKNTIEFIGLWEQMHNLNFKSIEFDAFKNEAGSNAFSLTPQRWIEKTNAIGIISKSGRYGGTYAHRDIAFEFATWLSPTFKLYLIKEYQRVKEIESNQFNLEWNVKRVLSKVNYTIQTDAVKDFILPKTNYSKQNEWLAYADEADLLNMALFKCTAKQWREANSSLAAENKNLRDIASINELAILSNLESTNADMIRDRLSKEVRFEKLYQMAQYQKEILDKQNFIKSIKKMSEDIFLNNQNKIME
jgi:KilA-N domain